MLAVDRNQPLTATMAKLDFRYQKKMFERLCFALSCLETLQKKIQINSLLAVQVSFPPTA